MQAKYIMILVLLVLISTLFPAAQALFGFDEFTDDVNQTIVETVENNLGNNCTDCNASFWIYYPNGTIRGFYLMKYNVSSSNYLKQIAPGLKLVSQNTTIYTIKLRVNRTPAGQIFNGSSDRTIITIYDVLPGTDSQWDVGLVLILLVIQWTFALLAYRFHEEHPMVKYGFFAIALFFNAWLMALGNRILVINGVITTNFTTLFTSTEVLALVMNFIFTGYIFLYLIYYMIHNVLGSANNVKGAK